MLWESLYTILTLMVWTLDLFSVVLWRVCLFYLRMLSDRRQFVCLISFQLSMPNTILCRWQTIDAYHPGHDSVNNNTRWCHLSRGSLIYLAIIRIFLVIGIGSDHPMSATITSGQANLPKRGIMLVYIFANQGWCSFVGFLVTISVLACYKDVMEAGESRWR